MALTQEEMQTLIDMKLAFYQNEDVRDKFIDVLMVNHPKLAVDIFSCAVHHGKKPIAWAGQTYYLRPNEWDEIINHVYANKKVEAIKALRAATGMSLKDAKDCCEATWPEHFPTYL
jgi:hypothetical protein